MSKGPERHKREAKEKFRAHRVNCFTTITPSGANTGLRRRAPITPKWGRSLDKKPKDLLDALAEEMTECDCNGGDMSRHEYRYFNASFNYVTKDGKPADGLTPDEVRKYTRQDYESLERLNAGDWCYLGIRRKKTLSGYSNHLPPPS